MDQMQRKQRVEQLCDTLIAIIQDLKDTNKEGPVGESHGDEQLAEIIANMAIFVQRACAEAADEMGISHKAYISAMMDAVVELTGVEHPAVTTTIQ